MAEPDAPDAEQLGFHSIRTETTAALPVEGTVPDWLSGSLIRNGPGSFAVGEGTVDHWFDGLAMLTRYTFEDGAVRYANRFLRTDSYEAARAGEFDGGFATGSSTLRERLWNLLAADTYDNTNIIVERLDGEYYALTETTRWVQVDPATLATVGDLEYDGPVPSGQLACAHLQYDPDREVYVNVETAFGRTNYYHVYQMRSPDRRALLASVPTDRPSYMHSFALTPNYAVLTEFPFDVNPLAFLKPGEQGPFIENFAWRPEADLTVHVIDRHGGGVVGQATTDPVFGFHHVNAFETEEGDVVFDLETLPDPSAIDSLDLAALRGGELNALAGRLDRYRITDPAGDPAVERVRRLSDGTGLPTVSPAARLDEHRYVYAQGTEQPATEWPRAVRKVDTEGGETEWSAGYACSEPIFVPRPDGDGEDDGVVLTVALDFEAERSLLVVLDGETMTELARAPLPYALPYDFHGRFFPELTPQ
jgi:beta-carotene 15,15'-monooxygenase